MEHKQTISDEEQQLLLAWLLKYCRSNPDGVKQEQIERALKTQTDFKFTGTIVDIAIAINSLTSRGQIIIFRLDNICIWKPVAEEKVGKMAGLDAQERLVYMTIERESNMGIWIKDLRKRTNIFGQGVLEKILKGLQTRKLIKAEKSIAGKNKKVFMLYELKPAEEVTGGTWYRAHDMDVEFIDTIRKASLISLRRKGPQTAAQVTESVKELKITSVDLNVSDMETILSTLFMERSIEVVPPSALPAALQAEHKQSAVRRRALAVQREEARKRKRELDIIRKAKSEKRMRAGYHGDIREESEGNEGGEEEEEESDDDDDEDDDDLYQDEKVYKIAAEGGYDIPSVTSMPCIGCELMSKCAPGNLVEPATCVYLREWLQLDYANKEVKAVGASTTTSSSSSASSFDPTK